MKIEVTNRGQDGVVSFKHENSAELLQLEWLSRKSEGLGLDAFAFSGWDDDGGGISLVVKLKNAKT